MSSSSCATREKEVDMKHLLSVGRVQLIVAVSLANFILPVLQAESRCPGSAASVTPRLVQRALIVIPVRVNQTGPYDFIVDTGSQITVMLPTMLFRRVFISGAGHYVVF